MLRYFLGSIIVTVLGLMTAFGWGERVHHGTGFYCVFIALVLAVLEISLSFDNAVVNAMKLEKMSEKWRHRFITWGILIAVFGMRFLFPLLVVAIFARQKLSSVLNMALNNVDQYAYYLQIAHPPIITFGGAFLMMLFIDYFFNTNKKVHWIKPIETQMQKLGKYSSISVIITLSTIAILLYMLPTVYRIPALCSGLGGMATYITINGLAKWLEKHQEKLASDAKGAIKCSGFIGFMYLELIDASFSLDGVLGAFALSTDIIIITIGLFIGAMFVRSLTILLVDKKTLAEYIYLEHGAHWAIGALSVLMFISSFHEVPEVITGLLGLVFIVTAFISSIIHNKRINNNDN